MTEPTFSMCLSFFSPQDDSIHSAVTPCCPQTSIPLLMACTANVKTVVANPMVYLTNLTHDILQTINALDSPPHPDVVNNEVRQSYLCISSSSTVDCLKWPFLLIERPWIWVYWRRPVIMGNLNRNIYIFHIGIQETLRPIFLAWILVSISRWI